MIKKAKEGDVLYTLNYDYVEKKWSIIEFVVSVDFDINAPVYGYLWDKSLKSHHPKEVYRTLKRAKKALDINNRLEEL